MLTARTRDQIILELTSIFHRVFDDESIRLTDEMKASDIPEWDSLNQLKLIIAAEEQFEIRFNTAEISNMKNVGEFVASISRLLARAS